MKTFPKKTSLFHYVKKISYFLRMSVKCISCRFERFFEEKKFDDRLTYLLTELTDGLIHREAPLPNMNFCSFFKHVLVVHCLDSNSRDSLVGFKLT